MLSSAYCAAVAKKKKNKTTTMSEHRRNRMKQYKDCAEPSIIQGWNHTQIIICSADHHLKEGEKMEKN